MKIPFIVFLGALACESVLANENDFRCFTSIGLKRPLRLQFSFPTAFQDLGFVTYKNGSGTIPVKLKKEKIVDENPGGRPWVFQTDWEEVSRNGAGGKYRIVSQGAQIYDFKYFRKDGKIFEFEVDLEASSEKGCQWDGT